MNLLLSSVRAMTAAVVAGVGSADAMAVHRRAGVEINLAVTGRNIWRSEEWQNVPLNTQSVCVSRYLACDLPEAGTSRLIARFRA